MPPFCICLSCPTDTAENANICVAGVRRRSAAAIGAPTYPKHDPVWEEGLERYAHDCAGAVGPERVVKARWVVEAVWGEVGSELLSS